MADQTQTPAAPAATPAPQPEAAAAVPIFRIPGQTFTTPDQELVLRDVPGTGNIPQPLLTATPAQTSAAQTTASPRATPAMGGSSAWTLRDMRVWLVLAALGLLGWFIYNQSTTVPRPVQMSGTFNGTLTTPPAPAATPVPVRTIPIVTENICSKKMNGSTVTCLSDGSYKFTLANGDVFKYSKCSESRDNRGFYSKCYPEGNLEYQMGVALKSRMFWHTVYEGKKRVIGWDHTL